MSGNVDRPIHIQVNAAEVGERYRDILDEINAWKLYSYFGDRPLFRGRKQGWMKQVFPWIEYVRCPAAFGGNYGPSIANDCDARRISDTHMANSFWECGTTKGEPGSAARYEIYKTDSQGQNYLDFEYFDECLGRLLTAGFKPHLNISSANEAFTGEGAYRYYHWNENPVRDFPRWREFVTAVFKHLDDRFAIEDWRFSCVNEPNCEKRDRDGVVYKVGYRGDEHEYAEQYFQTLSAARTVKRNIRFQMGNYVVRPSFMPPIKPLIDYLGAFKARMQNSGFSFDDVTFQSLSMYEVPYQNIHGATTTRFDFLKGWFKELDIPVKPLKIDEFELHPEIKRPYDQEHPDLPIDTTHYAASWLTKATKAFQDQGVESAAAWIGRLGKWERGAWNPYPKYYASAFFPLLAGRIDIAKEGEVGRFRETDNDAEPWYRLAVAGEFIPEYAGEKQGYSFVESIAASEPGSGRLRVLIFHHHTDIVPDAVVAENPNAVDVSVTVSGLQANRRYVTKAYSIAAPGSIGSEIHWDQESGATTDFAAVELGTFEVTGSGTLTVGSEPDASFRIPRYGIMFLELAPS